MGMRAALEKWFDAHDLRPRLVGEFQDSTLMEVAASGALGFTEVHSVVAAAALKHYGLKISPRSKTVRVTSTRSPPNGG